MKVVPLKPLVHAPLVDELERLLVLARQGKIRSMGYVAIVTQDGSIMHRAINGGEDGHSLMAGTVYLQSRMVECRFIGKAVEPDPEPETPV